MPARRVMTECRQRERLLIALGCSSIHVLIAVDSNACTRVMRRRDRERCCAGSRGGNDTTRQELRARSMVYWALGAASHISSMRECELRADEVAAVFRNILRFQGFKREC